MKNENKTIRELWLEEAAAEWKQNVRDTQKVYKGDLSQIGNYFEENGWANWLGKGGYTEKPTTSWCGHFAGAMGQRAGLDYNVAHFVTPSTARLFSGKRWAAAGVPMAERWRLRKDGQTVVSDHSGKFLTLEELIFQGVTVIATIAATDYGDQRNVYGGHVVLIDRVTETGVETIEGNAYGELGNGKWGEGVVRRRGKHERKFSDFRIIYEMNGPSHFEDFTHVQVKEDE